MINEIQKLNEIEEDKIIKGIRNLFGLKRKDKAIINKDKVLRTLFESDEDDYYEPKKKLLKNILIRLDHTSCLRRSHLRSSHPRICHLRNSHLRSSQSVVLKTSKY